MAYEIKMLKAEDRIVFVGGRLKLTPVQSVPRMEYLKDEGSGIFTVLSRIEFKAGEIIGIVGNEIPKAELAKTTEVKKAIPEGKEVFVPAAKPEAAIPKEMAFRESRVEKVKAVRTRSRKAAKEPIAKKIIDPTA
jgi:hypothetical protein